VASWRSWPAILPLKPDARSPCATDPPNSPSPTIAMRSVSGSGWRVKRSIAEVSDRFWMTSIANVYTIYNLMLSMDPQ
jgi:hypothetical protein